MIWVCIERLKKMLLSSSVILVKNWNVIIILKALFHEFCICMLNWFFMHMNVFLCVNLYVHCIKMQLKQSEYLKSVQKYKVNCGIIIIYI